MYLLTSIKDVIPLLIITLLLSACGGGSGSDTSSNPGAQTSNTTSAILIEEVSGQFIDGPVEGLSYLCSSVDSRSGLTDANGVFTCYEGNTITFKVGDVVLGSNLVTNIITPVTLHPNDPQAALNVARLLQSLDDDGNLTKIKIDNTLIIGRSDPIDIKASSFETKLKEILSKKIVSREDAVAHINKNLQALDSLSTFSSDGTRYVTREDIQESDIDQTVTFLGSDSTGTDIPVEDNTTSDADDEDQNTDNSNTSGQSGQSSTPDDASQDDTDIPVEDNTTSDADDEDQNTDNSNTSGQSGQSSAPEDASQEDTDTNIQIPEEIMVCASGGKATHEGVVTDLTGSPIEGVKVNIGGCEETTGNNGSYVFSNIVTNERAVVNFMKAGYYRNSTIIKIQELYAGSSSPSSNFLEFSMDAYDNHWYADENYHVHGTHIDVIPGSYTDRSGKQYQGTIELGLAYEDHSSTITRDTFPGEFKGKSTTGELVTLMTYRFMVIDAKDQNGDQLLITDDAMLKFPKVLESSAKTIPLWYYNHNLGLWIEEGYATRNSAGDYEGTVPHLGTWCLADTLIKAPGIYNGNVLYEDRTPAKGIRVFAIGDNWISTDLSTDEEGDFRLEVIPDSMFTIKVYDTKGHFEASFEGDLEPVASGDMVP